MIMMEVEREEPPTMIIDAPLGYERNHQLKECPLCNRPDPLLVIHIPVRSLRYFDINLYSCETHCQCSNSCLDLHRLHRFSAKHDFLKDASHLKIYDRTHKKGVW